MLPTTRSKNVPTPQSHHVMLLSPTKIQYLVASETYLQLKNKSIAQFKNTQANIEGTIIVPQKKKNKELTH